MRYHGLLVGLGYALLALALALVVIAPVFYLVNVVYDHGKGLTPLLVAVVVVWLVLAWLLSRRRVSL